MKEIGNVNRECDLTFEYKFRPHCVQQKLTTVPFQVEELDEFW